MRKRIITFFLLTVLLYWAWPDIYSTQINPQTQRTQLVVDRQFLGFKVGESVYPRERLDAVVIRYHKAYMGFKMRGMYRVGIQMRDGTFLLLHQYMTELHYEPLVALGPGDEIKMKQAREYARELAAATGLGMREELASGKEAGSE